jgi:hypothetical protein
VQKLAAAPLAPQDDEIGDYPAVDKGSTKRLPRRWRDRPTDHSFEPIPIVTVSGACEASAYPNICRPAFQKQFWIACAWGGAWCRSVTTRKIPGDDHDNTSPSGAGFRSKPPASLKILVICSAIWRASPFTKPGRICTTPLLGAALRQLTRASRSLAVIFLGPSIFLSSPSAAAARCCSTVTMESSPTRSTALCACCHDCEHEG